MWAWADGAVINSCGQPPRQSRFRSSLPQAMWVEREDAGVGLRHFGKLQETSSSRKAFLADKCE